MFLYHDLREDPEGYNLSLELVSVNAEDRRNNWLTDDIRIEKCLAVSLCNDFEDVFLFKTIGLVLVPVSRVYSHEIYLKQWLKNQTP